MKARPFHHQRPLVVFALAFACGIWAGVRFPFVPLLFLFGLVLCLGGLFLLHRAGRRRAVGVMGACLFAGMLLSGYVSHPNLPPAGSYAIDGIVAEDMVLREDGTAAGYLTAVTLTGEEGQHSLRKLYWTYRYDPEAPFLPVDGDRVHFDGSLYHPSGVTNPYGFDFRLFLLQRGAVAGVSGAKNAQVTAPGSRGLASMLLQCRMFLTQRVRDVFGEGSALPEALLLGVRENLPQEVQDSFSSAGVAHILAVSGLHVGLLAGALGLLLRRLLSLKGQFIVLFAFLFLYCALLDFSAPVVRASLLVVFAGLRRIFRRSPDGLTTLAAAFLLILFFRPLDLFSSSFQLSFGAVLGIVMLMPVLEKPLAFLRFRFLRDGVKVTLAATLGSFLPSVQVFHRFSLIGLIINPFVCGIFGVLLPLYAVVLLVGCLILPLGQALAIPLTAAGSWITAAIGWLGDLPFATLRVAALPGYVIAALVLVMLLCTRYMVLPKARKAALALCALVFSVGLWHGSICRDVQYIQLDMGQADAALILDGNETIVIDTGEYGGDLVSYLEATGRQADHVILTHLHSDHAGGMKELFASGIRIAEVIVPQGAFDQAIDESLLALRETLAEKQIPVRFAAKGDTLHTPRVSIEVTWPIPGTVRTLQDPNRYPLTLLCDLDGVKFFSAGDIPGEFEQYAARDADILKVSHHGSKSSTYEDFLSLVSPTAAIITASPSARYLPHEDTLKRLDDAGCLVYHTGELGAVRIRIARKCAYVTPYLTEGGLH